MGLSAVGLGVNLELNYELATKSDTRRTAELTQLLYIYIISHKIAAFLLSLMLSQQCSDLKSAVEGWAPGGAFKKVGSPGPMGKLQRPPHIHKQTGSSLRLTTGSRPFPLARAVELFLGPPWKVSSLRTEIRKGRLEAVRIAGKLAVTERAIKDMIVRCREKRKDRGYTSESGSIGRASIGSSETVDTKKAQDALLTTLRELSRPSPATSPRSTRRRKQADNLIKLPSRT
jgi:hypothetical protein